VLEREQAPVQVQEPVLGPVQALEQVLERVPERAPEQAPEQVLGPVQALGQGAVTTRRHRICATDHGLLTSRQMTSAPAHSRSTMSCVLTETTASSPGKLTIGIRRSGIGRCHSTPISPNG